VLEGYQRGRQDSAIMRAGGLDMVQMTFNARIENGRLIIDLPDDMPEGPVEVVVRAMPSEEAGDKPLSLQRAREILRAAGKLSDAVSSSEIGEQLTAEEFEELRKQSSGGRPSHEIISEDRGEY
jgi:hypothetical protein